MSKKIKLIPELRFPEFENEGDWNYDKIDNLFHLQDGYAFSSNAFTNSKLNTKQVIRITDINNRNKNDDKVFVSEETAKTLGVEKYKVKKGDLLLSLTGAAGFNFFIWESDDAYINQRTMKLNSKKKENDSLKVLLEPLVHSKINEIGTGQNNNLSKDALKEIEFPYPNPTEQEKIASCLSSLDDLIESHNQKLDLLKDHKKGLMQNLFPQEGEKVPKYRFPEFTKDGEWTTKKLRQIGEPLMCKRVFKEQTSENPTDGVPFYKIGTFGKEADSYIPFELFEEYKNKYSFPKVGDILVSASGTIGRLVVYDGAPAFFQDSNIIWLGNDEKNILNSFLLYCYATMKWQTSDGGIISRLYNSDFKNMQVRFPKNKVEQQKIASCLAFLDELISENTEKIEQLKQHKKGLMQGLFPKMID